MNVSTRLSVEQLAALNDDPKYKTALINLTNDDKIMFELHQMLPSDVMYLIDQMLKEVEASYGYVDFGACEGIITSYVATWYARQKLEFTDDPVAKLLEVLRQVLSLRTAIIGFKAVLATT